MSNAARIGSAFDAIAAEYDVLFTESRIGQAQRDAVWKVIDCVFRPGQRVLEINCGTGADAVHLAGRGVYVHACDASAAMVEIAGRRVQRAGAQVTVERRAIEELSSVAGLYDGVFSNFGGLNCVEDLGGAIAQIDRLLRPGGNIVLCYLGPICAWEVAWYLSCGEPRKAFRRWRRNGGRAQLGNGDSFVVRYPSVRALLGSFGRGFRLMEHRGVGVFVPPSYVERLAIAHPRAVDAARRLDRAVSAWPVFRSVADHVLLHLRKVTA